jgi:uncharacterized protein (DUF488 family)
VLRCGKQRLVGTHSAALSAKSAVRVGRGRAGAPTWVSNTVFAVPAPLYTVGYEGRSLPEFLDRLAQAGVSRLVDVRELPLSRRPGFSKTKLAEALGELGVEYLHVRPLGNPKPNRERYWAGDVEAGADVYRRHLHNGSYSALVELADSLDDEPTCLMCFERDYEHCHRAVLVESLADLRPDVSVEHL